MVVLRFAPSPTGYMHVGNARTALLNWLFARKNQGQFLLRFDDTDLQRSKDIYAQSIEQDLMWLGWHWDGCFRQSQRLDHYSKATASLKAQGLLYPCYETPEELSFKRKRQLSQGRPPLYDRAALSMTEGQRKIFEAEGRQPHWRFKLAHETITWQDMAHGPIHVDTASLSDPILLRADGSPVYTLCSVVDDMDYGITHILRGDDHITNTAVQILLMRALDGEKAFPQCGHFPLMTDQEGGGLSKRLGSLGIKDLRDQKLEAQTLTSYLATLGTGAEGHPILTMDEVIQQFDPHGYGRSSPKFSVDDLHRLNGKLLHQWPYEVIKDRCPQVSAEMWTALQGNLAVLDDIHEWMALIHDPVTPDVTDPAYLETALGCLPLGDWDEETWGLWTGALKKETGRKGKDLFLPLRLALTGKPSGPEMKNLLPLLPRETVVRRLKGERA